MRCTQNFMIAAAAVIAAVFTAVPAAAQRYNGDAMMFPPAVHSYSGAWPVTVSHSQRDNGTGCLTLKSVSSGQASLDFGGTSYPFGSFVIIDGIILVNITEPLYGQNGSLLFTAHASGGSIGHGMFEDDRGGSSFDIGRLTFGTKNGC